MKAGEIVVFDKAYVDFKHLKVLNARDVSWVTRTKDNMLYEVMGQHAAEKREPHDTIKRVSSSSEPEVATAGVMGQQLPRKRQYVRKKCKVLLDERIRFIGVNTKEHYPDDLRRITAEVEVKGKMVVMTFITNNFEGSPYFVCELY